MRRSCGPLTPTSRRPTGTPAARRWRQLSIADGHHAQFLYLTTTGWRSGRSHRIEIWYVDLDDRYYLISELRWRAHWVQNLESNPTVLVDLGGLHTPGRGRFVLPEQDPALVATVRAAFDAKYGWSNGLIVELRPDAARDPG